MKIGLIAMSGVRIKNPKLIELGVTLPQFVNRGKVIASLPSLGLLLMSTVTPKDVEAEYIEVADLKALDQMRTDFDLVGISSFTAQAYEMYELADWYRAKGVPVVLGGLHVSMCYEEAKEHADSVVVGEGEETWPILVEDFKRGGKDALKPYYREGKPGLYDLGQSPMPNFEQLLGRPYNRITVQTVRGCPWDCEFCGASKLYGPKYRRKPVEMVVAELKKVKELWGDDAFVELADDNSFANRAWTREFLTAIEDLGVRWFTETDISIADDDEVLTRLYRSGCRQILIGLESINPQSLDHIDRANWKLKQLKRYQEAIDKIQSHGVTVNGCFIVGNDGDDKGIFEGLRDFIKKSNLIEVQVTILTPFPGTHLIKRLKQEGRLLYDKMWDRCTLFDVTYQPKNMTPEELEDGHMWLMGEVYNESEFRRRKRHYIELAKNLVQV